MCPGTSCEDPLPRVIGAAAGGAQPQHLYLHLRGLGEVRALRNAGTGTGRATPATRLSALGAGSCHVALPGPHPPSRFIARLRGRAGLRHGGPAGSCPPASIINREGGAAALPARRCHRRRA